jgi:hypothetical protein
VNGASDHGSSLHALGITPKASCQLDRPCHFSRAHLLNIRSLTIVTTGNLEYKDGDEEGRTLSAVLSSLEPEARSAAFHIATQSFLNHDQGRSILGGLQRRNPWPQRIVLPLAFLFSALGFPRCLAQTAPRLSTYHSRESLTSRRRPSARCQKKVRTSEVALNQQIKLPPLLGSPSVASTASPNAPNRSHPLAQIPLSLFSPTTSSFFHFLLHGLAFQPRRFPPRHLCFSILPDVSAPSRLQD